MRFPSTPGGASCLLCKQTVCQRLRGDERRERSGVYQRQMVQRTGQKHIEHPAEERVVREIFRAAFTHDYAVEFQSLRQRGGQDQQPARVGRVALCQQPHRQQLFQRTIGLLGLLLRLFDDGNGVVARLLPALGKVCQPSTRAFSSLHA